MLWTADSGQLGRRPRSTTIKPRRRLRRKGTLVPSEDGTAAFTVDPDRRRRRRQRRRRVDDLREQLRADAPDGVTVQVTGPAGIQADLGKVFDGADLRLLLATMLSRRAAAGDHLPQPGAVARPARPSSASPTGSPSSSRPTSSTSPGVAWDEYHDRHPLGAGLRCRHRLRPAADLALPRRAEHDRRRGTPRWRARCAARPRPCSAAPITVFLARADPAALARSRDPRPRSGLRRRRRHRRDLRARRPAGRPGALRSLGLLADGAATSATRPGRRRHSLWHRVGDAVVSRRPRSVRGRHRGRCSPSSPAALLGITTGLDQADQFLDRPEAITAAERLGESFPAGTVEPTQVLTRADGEQVLAAVEDIDGRRLGPGHGHRRRHHPDRRRPRRRARQRRGRRRPSSALRDGRRRLPRHPRRRQRGRGDRRRGRRRRARPAADRPADPACWCWSRSLLLLRSVRRRRCCWCSPSSRRTSPHSAPRGGSSPGVFGFEAMDVGVPLFAFLFLVALGVDYNIFLVTRAREEAREHGTRDGHAARADRHRRRDHQRRHPAGRGLRRARRAAAGRARPARHDHLRRRPARHPGRAHRAGAGARADSSATGSGGRGRSAACRPQRRSSRAASAVAAADRRGDRLGHVGVEDARDDEVRVELVVARPRAAIASAARSSMSMVTSAARGVEQAAEDAGEGQHVVDLVGVVRAAASPRPRRTCSASAGSTSGSGLASAKTIGVRRPSSAIHSAVEDVRARETPMKTSAPRERRRAGRR